MFRPNWLKKTIAAGGNAYGFWLMGAMPTLAEIAANVGYDVLVIDNEHGPGDLFSTIDMLRAAQGTDVTCMVRAPSHDKALLSRLVDVGVNTLLVPMVNTADQARAIVDACKYPPEGRKGTAAGAVRASGYGLANGYMDEANDNLFIAVQIESVEAVENAAEIAAVPGVDMIFIGPNDLAGSFGKPGQTDDPECARLVGVAQQAAHAVGKPTGSIPRKGMTFRDVFDEGFKLVIDGADIGVYREGVRNAVAAYRSWADL